MNRVSIGFYELSVKIVNNIEHIHDTNYRTAISRLYYAVFLEIRTQLKNKLPADSFYRTLLLEESEFPKIHALIKLAVLHLNKEAGVNLDKLHEYRKISDYSISRKVSKEIYEESYDIYNMLLSFLQVIKSFQPKRIEEAFERALQKIELRRKQRSF